MARARGPRTSELLTDYANSCSCERVRVDEIVAALGDRGLGVLMAVFALPNVLPSTVPFGNVLTGIPVIIFAIQLMLGAERTILPGFVARRTVSVTLLKKSAPRLAAVLAWIESLLRPRLDFMSTPSAERLIGILCVLLSIMTTLPIPFGHQLPALAVVLIGLGLIERDGLAMLAGVVLGAAGLAALVMLVLGIVHGAHHLLHIHSLRYWLMHLL